MMVKTLTNMTGVINCNSTCEMEEMDETTTATAAITIDNMNIETEVDDDYGIAMKMDAELTSSVKVCDKIAEETQSMSMSAVMSNSEMSFDYTAGENSMKMSIKSDGDVVAFLSKPSKSYTLTNPETGETITISIEVSVDGEDLFTVFDDKEVDE